MNKYSNQVTNNRETNKRDRILKYKYHLVGSLLRYLLKISWKFFVLINMWSGHFQVKQTFVKHKLAIKITIPSNRNPIHIKIWLRNYHLILFADQWILKNDREKFFFLDDTLDFKRLSQCLSFFVQELNFNIQRDCQSYLLFFSSHLLSPFFIIF